MSDSTTETTQTQIKQLHPIYKLWVIDYELEIDRFVDSLIDKLRSEKDLQKTRLWTAMLTVYYVREITKKKGTDANIKSQILKQGEFSIISTDSQKLLYEIHKSVQNLDEVNQEENDEKIDLISLSECLRISAYLNRVPMVVPTVHKTMDMVSQFSLNKQYSAIASYLLLENIYEKFDDPAYKGIIGHLEQDFWEYFATLAFKVMSQFMFEGTMEYILYYELPPGGHNDVHIKRCERLVDLSILTCKMVSDALPKMKFHIDKQMLGFCSNVLENSDPQPLINLSYRLLDFSSEDFYITLPKDQINHFIHNSIKALNA